MNSSGHSISAFEDEIFSRSSVGTESEKLSLKEHPAVVFQMMTVDNRDEADPSC